jgi:hypothetical protein
MRNEVFAMINWCIEDIQYLRPNWDDKKVLEAANFSRKGLEDTSVETGWEILGILLDDFEEE